jgi:hypothetical protein
MTSPHIFIDSSGLKTFPDKSTYLNQVFIISFPI